MGAYIDDTAKRLGIETGKFTASTSYTYIPLAYIPAVLAEIFSWTGVITANARFFCFEYSMWLLVAMVWAWDSAELLNKSKKWGDLLLHTGVFLCSLGLFLFNALFEIPHFFANYERAGASAGAGISSSIWE